MERGRDSLGPDHPITLAAAAAVTISLARLGATEQAHTLAADTVDASPQQVGPRPPVHPFPDPSTPAGSTRRTQASSCSFAPVNSSAPVNLSAHVGSRADSCCLGAAASRLSLDPPRRGLLILSAPRTHQRNLLPATPSLRSWRTQDQLSDFKINC